MWAWCQRQNFLTKKEQESPRTRQGRGGAPPWLPGKCGAIEGPNQPSPCSPLQPFSFWLLSPPSPSTHAMGGWGHPTDLLICAKQFVAQSDFSVPTTLRIQVPSFAARDPVPVCASITALCAVHSDGLFFTPVLGSRVPVLGSRVFALCLRQCLAPSMSLSRNA